MTQIPWVTGAERVSRMLAHDPYAVTREPFPAPRRTSRDDPATRHLTMPGPCLSLAEFARELGWEVRTQFAQGHYPHATTGRPGALKDSIALRFGGHALTDRQAFAVYVRNAKPAGTWSWEYVMAWGPDLPAYARCGITELKAFLTMSAVTSGEVMRLWVEELQMIKENGEALRKQRDQDRKEIRALAAGGETLDSIKIKFGERYSREDLIKIISAVSSKAEKESMR